jgi:hypothetical protein
MSTTKSFVDLMSDPSFIEQQRATRDREEREAHERRVRRGSHEPGNVKPSPQQLRDSITQGRELHFEHAAHRSRSRSAPQGTRAPKHIGGTDGQR